MNRIILIPVHHSCAAGNLPKSVIKVCVCEKYVYSHGGLPLYHNWAFKYKGVKNKLNIGWVDRYSKATHFYNFVACFMQYLF